jgi:hypothetical protein
VHICRYILIALLSLSSVATLSAHDTLPSNWCIKPTTQPRIVSTFDFSPVELQAYSNQFPNIDHPVCYIDPDTGERKCVDNHGIVDNWSAASRMSHAYCAAASSEAIPFVTGPAQFNDPDEHHAGYDFNLRLTGVCVVCVPRDPEPTPTCPEGLYCLPTDD